MGQIADKIKKAKTKAKAKVAAKTGKCGRNARECAKSACVLLAFASLAALFGCATTGEQPARSQTMTNEFRDCVIVMAAKATVTNGVVAAEGEAMPTLELFTQTQANEGSETISPTASPTNTVDTDASLDIPVTKTGGAKTVSSAVTKAAKDCLDCDDGACEDRED